MKSIITVSLKTLGFVALMASTSVYATNIDVGGSTLIIDDRESAGDKDASGWDSIYNIDQMNISWSSNETINVDIFTNFANLRDGFTNNNRYDEGDQKIVYGDLLIKTWNSQDGYSKYAFNLGADRYSKNLVDSNTSTGGLYAVNSFMNTGKYHNTDKSGIVFGNKTNDVKLGTNTSWGTTIGESQNQWGHNQGIISFSFNVAGLDMFQNATVLGLSWAMSCYNDNVAGWYAVNRPTSGNTTVPEPSTMILMLLALVGLVYRQKKISNKFSA